MEKVSLLTCEEVDICENPNITVVGRYKLATDILKGELDKLDRLYELAVSTLNNKDIQNLDKENRYILQNIELVG